MATLYWEPKAVAVAQVSTVQVTAFDATTTYTITLGGVAVSVTGNTDVNTTASDLQTALAASTHPYFTAVTWTQATDTVTGTAGTAGVPFVAASSVTGGTGTIGSVTDTTAATGPNFWDEPENWNSGAIPVDTDDVIVRDSAIPICYGLAQSAVQLTSLTIEQSFTGKIGLRGDQLTLSADGTALDTTVPEYRLTYLEIDWDECDIGEHSGPTEPAGSTRIRLDNAVAGPNLRVHSSAAAGDDRKPAILVLLASASATAEIRSAPGGVGFATGLPGETSTIGTIRITDPTTGTQVFVGDGVTLTTFSQRSGLNRLSAAADITTVTTFGGELDIEGIGYAITTLDMRGGVVRDKHEPTSGAAWTTINLGGGATLDLTGSETPRTCTTFNPDDGTLTARWDLLTVTTFTEPSDLRSLTMSPP